MRNRYERHDMTNLGIRNNAKARQSSCRTLALQDLGVRIGKHEIRRIGRRDLVIVLIPTKQPDRLDAAVQGAKGGE